MYVELFRVATDTVLRIADLSGAKTVRVSRHHATDFAHSLLNNAKTLDQYIGEIYNWGRYGGYVRCTIERIRYADDRFVGLFSPHVQTDILTINDILADHLVDLQNKELSAWEMGNDGRSHDLLRMASARGFVAQLGEAHSLIRRVLRKFTKQHGLYGLAAKDYLEENFGHNIAHATCVLKNMMDAIEAAERPLT